MAREIEAAVPEGKKSSPAKKNRVVGGGCRQEKAWPPVLLSDASQHTPSAAVLQVRLHCAIWLRGIMKTCELNLQQAECAVVAVTWRRYEIGVQEHSRCPIFAPASRRRC